MRDLLKCKPSLAEVTGISKSRLDSFGVHLRAYLVGSTMTNTYAPSVLSSAPPVSASVELSELGLNVQSSVVPLKPSRSRHHSNLGTKISPLYQGSLSARPSSFKDAPRNPLKTVCREKFGRRGESYMSYVDNISATSQSISNASSSIESQDKIPEVTGTTLFPSTQSVLESFKFDADISLSSSASQVPTMGLPFLSPHYCWCPPVSSTVPYVSKTVASPGVVYDSASLLSSLLSNNLPSGLSTLKPLNLDEVSISKIPPLLPDPLVRLPLSLQTTQQIPTFTPLMCDPIVHIPVIDVCSSGQGYLVSAGPAITATIAPLHPNIVGPLMPAPDSAVEKDARETLRMLISRSNESNPPLMDLLPSAFTDRDEKHMVFAVGSRGLYTGTRDVDCTAKSISEIGFISSLKRSEECRELERCTNREKLVGGCEDDIPDGPSDSCSGHGFPDNIAERRSS